MDFLYRMHLVDFDPKDEKQIKKNWNWIKQAIRLSSDSLHQEIENKEYDSLPQFTKSKLIKYLIRGRYRSTPFGLWAGVGIGNFGNSNLIETPITYRIIKDQCLKLEENPAHKQTKFRLAPGSKEYADQIHYWSYCRKDEGWRISYLDKNPLVAILLTYFEKSDHLDFKIFQTFFKTKNKEQVLKIWEMLLESQLLIPYHFPEVETSPIPIERGLDYRLSSKITMDHEIQGKLENLVSEIGNLFVPVESDYMHKFKFWFKYTYDDRFVPISLLAHQKDFFIPTYSEFKPGKKTTTISPNILRELWNNAEEFDLKRCFKKKRANINHLQIAFKIFGQNELFIENMVCNRPFAYSGRFSLDPEIKTYIARNIKDPSSEVVFADFNLYESSKSNHITRHYNVFEYCICPFGRSSQNNLLGIDDLYLGFRQDRFILISQKLNKQVIPVVQHPLNPNQITHTLSRLIWEIGNQDQHRFIPYHDLIFQDSSYIPRLTWNGIILQGRKWILTSKSFSDKNDLIQFLRKSNFPCPILAGHLDRELLLDWTDPIELGFLWEELQRLEDVTIYECPWKEKSPFQKPGGQQLYPQFIYSWQGKDPTLPELHFHNRIIGSDPHWIYARIQMKEDSLIPFLSKPFPKLLKRLKKDSPIKKWYFLFYNSLHPEIRLRILPDDQFQKPIIESDIRYAFIESGWVESVQFAPYYPEIDKYGLNNEGISTSESIFHRESELILLGEDNGNFPPLLTLEEKDRRFWIIQTFHRLIEISGRQDLFFHYYQGLLKKIPWMERKELKKGEICHIRTENTLLRLDLFDEEFSKFSIESDEVLKRIIPNHLHMCCNRAFPMDSPLQERRVIYEIYRLLGKSLYCRSTTL